MGSEKERWSLPTLLVAALIVFSALLPPELNPAGLAIAAVLAAGLGFLLIFPAGPPPSLPRHCRLPVAMLAAYLALAVLTSPSPHRSLAFLLGSGLSLVAFAAARHTSRQDAGRERILQTVTGVASVTAAWGIYQRLFGLADTARRLRSLGQQDLDPQILRAESGRAFGPFLLPSSLGIYLAMALPLTLRSGIRCGWRGGKGLLWGSLLLLQLAGIGCSLSYGAVFSLAAASLLLLSPWRTAGLRRLLLPAAAGAALAVAWLLSARSPEGISPLLLRAGNWAAAVRVFLDHPFFGAGFGCFADAYAGKMTAGMNETAYVHNSYLQIAAEGGGVAAVWLLAAAGLLVVRIRRPPSSGARGEVESLVAIAPGVFLVHNLLDFSAYLPSLAITFAALAGATCPPRERVEAGGRGPGARLLPLPRAAILLLLLGGAAWELREARTRMDLEAGRALLNERRVDEGISLLRRAAERDSCDPDPPALLSEVILAEKAGDPESRAEGEKYARLSVELRPGRAYGHYLLATYRLAAGDRGEAWTEIARARELHPLRDLYSREEAVLRKLIADGVAPGRGKDEPR